MSNLKVAVRIRPMSERELEMRSRSSVSMDHGVVSVTNLKVPEHHAGDSRERIRKFAFDFCFGEETTQEEIFSAIEDDVSSALSNRYHACILAYGQSSTGKTYTMMGLQDEPGLTPRLCENIFKYFQSSGTEGEIKDMYTSVSYLEIYNERVQDLLSSASSGKSLKVREHPKKGPYVQGLTEHRVSNPEQLLFYLSVGNGNRRVAATTNNRRSSRSHSVFTISCSTPDGCCSRLHLVDLAGSERAHAIGQVANGRINSGFGSNARPRLKEGANINRSLVALGNVICALADQSGKSGKNHRKRFVPYRDSVLTWLLKETLSGNSKTVMIATISPSSECYSETVNTLRFGQRAKQIVNRPVVNEDGKEKLIRELRAEILRLKDLLDLRKISLTSNSTVEMSESSSPQNQEQNLIRFENETISTDCLPLAKEEKEVESKLLNKEVINLSHLDKELEEQSTTEVATEVLVQEELVKEVTVSLKEINISPPVVALKIKEIESVSFPFENEVILKSKIQEENLEAKNKPFTEISTAVISIEEPSSQQLLKEAAPQIIETLSEDQILLQSINEVQHLIVSDSSSVTENIKTDKLIPVIDINSVVTKPKPWKPVQLNRTLSVDFPKSVIGKLKKEFGSHETLPLAAVHHKNKAIRESTENLVILKADSKTVENSSRSGSISESSGKSTPKQEYPHTRRVHRKSEVVAAVTQRLYSQSRRKEDEKLDNKLSHAGSNSSIFPRSNLCTNARMKLQDLSHRALRANKRRVHNETQTESDRSTLRLKEKSTDVQDMNLSLLKVQDANVSAVAEVQSIGINCRVANYGTSLKLTRSCSAQTDEVDHQHQPKQNSQNVSFTSYLKNSLPVNVHSYTQPIYTSSVNINVSQNYPNTPSIPKEEISDDSLELDFLQQNVQLSTPDLISNHNSLEQQNLIGQQTIAEKAKVVTHAVVDVDKIPQKFYLNEFFATNAHELCIADSSIVPTVKETIKKVTVPIVCAPEIQHVEELTESLTELSDNSETCFVKPNQTYEPCQECKLIKTSAAPKPIIKPRHSRHHTHHHHQTTRDYTTEESDTDNSIASNNKKVRFSGHSKSKRKEMVNVLQNFMEEASTLLSKLNSVAKQVEKSEELRNKRTIMVQQKVKNCYDEFERNDTKECFVQTYYPYHDASSQTSSRVHKYAGPCSLTLNDLSDSDLNDNKWEQIVKSSCDKLEQCVRLAEHKTREDERKKFHNNVFDSNSLHKFPQPFSSDTEWKYSPNDYSSLETTHSASDYGSLPRREGIFRKIPYRTYSPKAYMKQLVAMRKQIVETSRSDLLEELKIPLSEN